MIVDETQNNQRNGYGNVSPPTIHHLFAQFYDEECLEYKDIKDKGGSKFTNLRNGELLDNVVYQKRLTITIDTLFLEANRRASEKNTKAFIHVVGIGLGVWKKHPCQDKLFMDCCGERIIALGSRLKNVSDICFSYIDHTMCLTYKHKDVIPIEGHPCEGIKVRINKREPNAQLNGKDQTKLLVVSYAWDGNALPGNEYWNKKLGSSGDSAAASSTQITELHNPFINPLVCSANLRVVTKDDVVEFVEFVEGIRRGQKRKEPEF